MAVRTATRVALVLTAGLMLVACNGKGDTKVTAPPSPPVVTTPAPAGAMPLLDKLVAAGWKLDALSQSLPPAQQRYQDQSGENPDYLQFAYDGGALRLYVSAAGQDVFAFVVDAAKYADALQLKDGQGYRVFPDGNLVAVVRSNPADATRFSGKAWKLTDLQAQLGAPSFNYHLHGLGDYVYVYVPESLVFQGSPGSVTSQDGTATADNVQRGLAKSLTGDLKLVNGALAKGKRSADGSSVAGLMARGGYWDNWIVVQTAGKAEQRYQAQYFIQDYFWLDDHRVVYAEMMNATFFVIDIKTGTLSAGPKANGEVQAFGVSAPGKVWYTGQDGARHEVAIP